jgi:hypothetical protein
VIKFIARVLSAFPITCERKKTRQCQGKEEGYVKEEKKGFVIEGRKADVTKDGM